MCHQTVSLAARHLEAHGIPTVIMGCAKDIVEHCGVPRFLFSDFPARQLRRAGPSTSTPRRGPSSWRLRVLESAPGPRTTVQSPLRWSEDAAWKLDYNNISEAHPRARSPSGARSSTW